jgi:hypothetical protein
MQAKVSALSTAHNAEYTQYMAEFTLKLNNFVDTLSGDLLASFEALNLNLLSADGLNILDFNKLMDWFNTHNDELIGLSSEEG